MPIEIVKTKITTKKRYVPPTTPANHPTHSSPRNTSTAPGYDSSSDDGKPTRKKGGKALDDDDPDLSKYDSRIDYANDRLRQTMVEIHDIKMYRSVNTKKISTTAYAAGLQGLPSSLTGGVGKEKGTGSDGKKRVLVGAEFSRFIVNKELAKADRLNVIHNRFHDPIEGVLQKSQQDIENSLLETRMLKHKTRKMNDRDDPHSLDNQRKELLEQSTEKREFAFLHPDKVYTLEEPKPTEHYVHFVIDSVNLHDEKKLEKELLQLESTLRKELDEGVETDSSDDNENSSKKDQHRHGRRRGGYLSDAHNHMLKRDSNQESSVVDKLQSDLDQLDRQLYREMIRKQHLIKHPAVHRSERSLGFKGGGKAIRRNSSSSSKSSLHGSQSKAHMTHQASSKHVRRNGIHGGGSHVDGEGSHSHSMVSTEYAKGNVEIIKNEELIKMKNKRKLFETSLRGFHQETTGVVPSSSSPNGSNILPDVSTDLAGTSHQHSQPHDSMHVGRNTSTSRQGQKHTDHHHHQQQQQQQEQPKSQLGSTSISRTQSQSQSRSRSRRQSHSLATSPRGSSPHQQPDGSASQSMQSSVTSLTPYPPGHGQGNQQGHDSTHQNLHSPRTSHQHHGYSQASSVLHSPAAGHSPATSGRNTIVSATTAQPNGLMTPKQPTRPQSGSPRAQSSGGVRQIGGRKTHSVGNEADSSTISVTGVTSAISGSSSIATISPSHATTGPSSSFAAAMIAVRNPLPLMLSQTAQQQQALLQDQQQRHAMAAAAVAAASPRHHHYHYYHHEVAKVAEIPTATSTNVIQQSQIQIEQPQKAPGTATTDASLIAATASSASQDNQGLGVDSMGSQSIDADSVSMDEVDNTTMKSMDTSAVETESQSHPPSSLQQQAVLVGDDSISQLDQQDPTMSTMDATTKLQYVFNYLNNREIIKKGLNQDDEEAVEVFSDDPAKRPGNLFSEVIIHRDNATMQFFVSPIGTIASKEAMGNADEKVKLIPYRDAELRNKIRVVENITDSIVDIVDNNNIVASFKDKVQGKEMVEEFRTIHETKASIIEARRARKAIEGDMDVVREVCETVTVRSASVVKSYRDQLKENVESKEKGLHSIIQGMKEKEFQSHRKFKVRRQQFRELDEMQTKLLDKKVPFGTTTYHAAHGALKKKGTSQDGASETSSTSDVRLHINTESEDEEDDDQFDPDAAPFSFLTELKQQQLKGNGNGNDVNSLLDPIAALTVSPSPAKRPNRHDPLDLESESPKPHPMLILRKGATLTEGNLEAFMKQLEDDAKPSTPGVDVPLTNDHNYYHNYEHQLRTIIKENHNNEIAQQHERLLSKTWFISLLRKIKKYKKSSSFAKVPPSLFVLLSSLQNLISVDVPLTKEILWILVTKTIKPSEHSSNLVYTALQHLFDVVGVGCEEIYQYLRGEGIEISPKLLMNVRRERKVKQLRAKLAAHKMSRKQGRALSHTTSQKAPSLIPVREDAELNDEDQDNLSPEINPNSPNQKFSKSMRSMNSSTSSSSFQFLEDSSMNSSNDSDLLSISQAGDYDDASDIGDLDQFV